ncbi:hypothetical protein [Pseudofulvimonas gallinarii]
MDSGPAAGVDQQVTTSRFGNGVAEVMTQAGPACCPLPWHPRS